MGWEGSLPFLSRLLRLLPASPSASSFSAPLSFFTLSQLNVRFKDEATATILWDRCSGVFLELENGLPFCLVAATGLMSGCDGALTLVKPAFTALNPPELTAVQPDVAGGGGGGGGPSLVGVSRSPSFVCPFTVA